MNILYLCHRIPYPPNKGDKIRSYHHIQYLAKRHAVYLACLIDDPDDWQYVELLQAVCREVHVAERTKWGEWFRLAKSFAGGEPLSLGAFVLPELQVKVNDLLGRQPMDCLVIFSSPMAEYVKAVRSVPKVIDFVDMDSEKWKSYAGVKPFPISLLYKMEAHRLGRYELAIASTCDHSVVISQEETAVLRDASAGTVIPHVIPNGVDYEFFTRDVSVERSKPVIVFTAALDYFPNVDGALFFCEDIFPHICQSIPQAQFLIVGRNPDPSLVRMAEKVRNVVVTGTVPDVRPYLSLAKVAVAPLRIARGVQNKILEAMAMELPVVGTTVAFQGLAVETHHGVCIADAPEAFAQAVVQFLKSGPLSQEAGRAARTFVAAHYDWSRILKEFEALLQETASKVCLPSH